MTAANADAAEQPLVKQSHSCAQQSSVDVVEQGFIVDDDSVVIIPSSQSDMLLIS